MSNHTILIAPDSFKGSITSVDVATALATGWHRARPDDEILLCPLADGGEGTLAAIEAAGGWDAHLARVHDPLGRMIEARWLLSSDGSRAFLEMARASGLSLVPPHERDPIAATSVGTGELIRTAAQSGATRLTIGIGGSATTDGGEGLLDGMGGGGELDWEDLRTFTKSFAVEVACDVTNPLLGPTGAAATYGPQKGATPAQVRELEHRLAKWDLALDTITGNHHADTPGAGAAGGVGYFFLQMQDWFASFALRPGIDLVMEATDFEARLARADLVITGEGRIDAQTGFGKTALGVAMRAHAAGVPCVAVGGGVELAGIDALAAVGAIAVPVVERPQSVEEAMAAGTAPLERCGERLARLTAILD